MPSSTRMFYFDALQLGGAGKVYVYEPVNDPLHPVEFWHKRFSGDNHVSHLHNRLFSPDGTMLQNITESIDQKGATLIQLELAYPSGDTTSMLAVKINDATTFLFGPPDTAIIAKYQIEYREPAVDSVRVILTRIRRFINEEQYSYQGKDYPAMRFVVKETLETETEGFTESEWLTTELYVLGLGLVYYRKPINKEFVLEYRLKDIMPYETFFSEK
ncbi:MAG TPA: hypothetical protein VI603_14995 [Saprospiraceae bacterium]|nr:hypothetical protein [Saprospiraceae bacterium]